MYYKPQTGSKAELVVDIVHSAHPGLAGMSADMWILKQTDMAVA